MEREWSIRAYKNGDEEGIYELYSAVHGEIQDKNQWTRWWNWKYRDGPAGAPIIRLAEANGKLVGQSATIRVKMEIGNEVVTGSESLDAMTHPDYRRQGIFEVLANKACKEATEKEIHILYAFPNKYSYPAFIRKLDWFDVCSLQTMIKPLNLENILRKYITNRFLLRICTVTGNSIIKAFYRTDNVHKVDGLTITKISSFDERVNGFWKKTSKDYEISFVRDSEYLNWRYVNRPDLSYTIYLAEKEGQILGYIVLRCQELRGLVFGYIFDLIFPLARQDIAQYLILRAVEHFKQENADLIVYHMVGPKVYRKSFGKSGFIFAHFISRRFRFIARTNTPNISETFLRNSRHWFVQMGDSDMIGGGF